MAIVESAAIGIDLGTSKLCAAIFLHDNVKMIVNRHGTSMSPSYVAFTNSELLIGDAAKNQAYRNPGNTVFNLKRLLGHQFDDEMVQSELKHFPFKVIEQNFEPKVLVAYKNEVQSFELEMVTAFLLQQLKQDAEMYLGYKVTQAVISMSTNCSRAQQQAIRDAATLAGLDVLSLIKETSAAAIAYGFNNHSLVGKRIVLIFDLGGGCLNVSIVDIEDGIYEVKSVASNNHLGGVDFDRRMIVHFIQEFKRKNGRDISGNMPATTRLRAVCEIAKCMLSSSLEASIELHSLHEDIDFYSTMTRRCFEELNNDLFQSILKPVEKALRDAKLAKSEIDEILLVGASTRIPKIQEILQNFFGGKQLNNSVNPDQCVAYGAAVQAAILTDNKSKNVRDSLLLDVIPFSLSVETAGGVMTAIIKRNRKIPTKATQMFTTFVDNQTSVLIKIFEGDRMMTRDNRLLDKFELSGIAPASRGVPVIMITIEIDVCYNLIVTAAHTNTNHKKLLIINSKSKDSIQLNGGSDISEANNTLARRTYINREELAHMSSGKN